MPHKTTQKRGELRTLERQWVMAKLLLLFHTSFYDWSGEKRAPMFASIGRAGLVELPGAAVPHTKSLLVEGNMLLMAQ
jgi:hypothetical protein